MKRGEKMYPNICAELGRISMPKYKLAKQLGVTQKTLSNWLSSGNIPANKLIEMAKIFDVTTDYLLGRSDVRT